jgi:cyanophycinase-like exopeptidase
MLGPLFLYSTSPAPHEAAILARVRNPARPLSAVVMQGALPEPSDADLAGLRSHFCTQGVEVVLSDSGLATRADAYRRSVADRLAAADLVLITGGSPELLGERTIGTPALVALRAASENGAVIAGCSAGAVVIGAGMVVGRRSLGLWGWLPRTVVAPHFGLFDIEPWVDAFPNCTVLGIPNDAMALVSNGNEVETIGDRTVILRTGADVQKLGPGAAGSIMRKLE